MRKKSYSNRKDYQNDYRILYEELRALVRLYCEIMDDDGTVYDDDEWTKALEETEDNMRLMVGLVDQEDYNV